MSWNWYGRLRRMMHGQLPLAGIVVGDDRARLQRDRGVAAEVKLLFHHMRGVSEYILDTTGIDLTVETEIAAEFRVKSAAHPVRAQCRYRRRRAVHRTRYTPPRLRLQPARAIGNDGDHRLPGPYDLVDRQRQLRGGDFIPLK